MQIYHPGLTTVCQHVFLIIQKNEKKPAYIHGNKFT
jgi:hypothetical protein